MGTLEVESPLYRNTKTTNHDGENPPAAVDEDDEDSPIEEVRLTVTNHDDPTLPVWTFRMWFLGLLSCCLLSFLNQFFSYRTEPLVITQITVQVASLPIGHFMAAVLPTKQFRLPGFGKRLFSLNPSPFNMKEHVLITIFANAGCAFGNGSAYGVGIVDIIIAFYRRKISFLAGWLLIVTTQRYLSWLALCTIWLMLVDSFITNIFTYNNNFQILFSFGARRSFHVSNVFVGMKRFVFTILLALSTYKLKSRELSAAEAPLTIPVLILWKTRP